MVRMIIDCMIHGKSEHYAHGKGWRCKQCNVERVALHRRERKRILVEWAGGRCCLCGYERYSGGLDFHHLDPVDKRFGVGSGGNTRSVTMMREEIEKCILVCATCHREVEGGLHDLHTLEQHRIQLDPLPTRQPRRCLCGATIDSQAQRCVRCAAVTREVIQWPSIEELQERVLKYGYSAVGRELGVSDNAVRKRIKNHSRVAKSVAAPDC